MDQCMNGDRGGSKAGDELPAHASAAPNRLHTSPNLVSHLVAELLAIARGALQVFPFQGLALHSSALWLHDYEEKIQGQAHLPDL